MKLLEENLGRTLFHKNHSNIFCICLLKKIKAKTNGWDLIKLLSSCTAKETTDKMKRQLTNWGEIFANDVTSKKLVSNTYKYLIQLNIKKTLKNPIKKWAEELNRHLNKEDMQWPTGTWKRCSATSPSGKCKSKPRFSPQTCQNGHH